MPDIRDDLAIRDLLIDDERYSSFLKTTCVKNQKSFSTYCRTLDFLLGRIDKHSVVSFDEIVSDKSRSFYIDILEYLMRTTRFTLHEIDACCCVICNVISKKNGNVDSNGHIRIPVHPENVASFMIRWMRYPTFEPIWHMKKRGDKHPLPTRKGYNPWQYLVGMYTDPENCCVSIPSNIKKDIENFNGYKQLIDNARNDGQSELKRRYGSNVDLSIRQDKKTENKIEERSTAEFMSAIMNGTLNKDSDIISNSKKRRAIRLHDANFMQN